MGVVTSKAPNPFISDKNDPRYTPLNEFNTKIGTRALIADLAFSGNQIHEHLYAVENMPLGDVLKEVQPMDIAVMGNRVGVVVEALKGFNTLGETDVVAIKVYEDMRYLPLSYRDSAVDFGYNSNTTKVGRTVTYILGNHRNNVDISSFVIAGKQCQPGSHSLYSGQIDIIKHKTYNPQTWTSIARAMKARQERYEDAEPMTAFVSKAFNFPALERKDALNKIHNADSGASLPADADQVRIQAYLDALTGPALTAVRTALGATGV